MNRLQGKSVVITGAAGGIGRGAAKLMAAEGARVLIGDIDATAAESAAREIGGGRAVGVGVDVTDEASASAMIDRAVAEFGGIDVLCNNVGGSSPVADPDLLGLALSEWDRVMALNVRSVVVVSKLAVPHMIAAGGGSIVNVSSAAGLLGDHTLTAYGAAKAAVIRLTQYVATQYGRNKIRCNAVVPGLIMTPGLREHVPADVIDQLRHQNPLHVLGEPEDIGYAMVYLASDESRFVTGQAVVVDGGLTAQSPTAAVHQATRPDAPG